MRREPLTTDDVDVTPSNTSLLVVDMVNEFVAQAYGPKTKNARKMVPRLRETIERSRDAGVQIIYFRPVNRPGGIDAGPYARMSPGILDGTTHSPGEQTEVYPELEPTQHDVVVTKHQYDGFFETELDSILKNTGADNVVITGTASHICCESTTRGGFFHGYFPIVLEDLNAAYDVPDVGWGEMSADLVNRMFFTTVATNFGLVTDSETYLQEIESNDE